VKNYIMGNDGYGNALIPCDTLWGMVYGNVNCTSVNPIYWFSGDPVERVGWLDEIAMDDRKFASIGPFSLEKSKPVEIILALVVGRGSDELNSITVAKENVQKAIAMANSGSNTGGSQFFINLKNNASLLDANYPVFGIVISNFSVVLNSTGNIISLSYNINDQKN
jgi:cyclophilin family peptidyl-prolyl cis-trans isomerase